MAQILIGARLIFLMQNLRIKVRYINPSMGAVPLRGGKFKNDTDDPYGDDPTDFRPLSGCVSAKVIVLGL